LLRGVSLGLFNEAVAMEKFTKWSAEHDANVAKRSDTAKTAARAKRNVPYVKKVASAAPSAPVADEAAAPSTEETKTEE
jgi:small subunit ribosomal protein S16